MNTDERELMIDGDIILYSCGFASEGEPVSHSCNSMKKMLTKMMDDLEVTRGNTIIALSGPDNFRDDIATILPYKGNRKEAPKPSNYKEMREYLLKYWNCVESVDEEADDVMGKWLTEPVEQQRIIATLDKDLNMVPGFHYNWRKSSLTYVTQEEADNSLICQLLTGDSTDNIPGLYKLTGTKASKKLKDLCCSKETFSDKFSAVLEVYADSIIKKHACDRHDAEELAGEVVFEIGQLLWMKDSVYGSFHDKVTKEIKRKRVVDTYATKEESE